MTTSSPHWDIAIATDNYEKQFLPILREIRPNWKEDEIVFKQSPKCANRGMLNTMVRCYQKDHDDGDDAVMLRVLNGDMDGIMDRALEIACIKYLQRRECALTILATFKNGYCYSFIKGEILSNLRLGEDPIWRRIAEEFAKIHAANVEEIPGFSKKITNLERLRICEEQYPENLKDPKKNERFKKELPDITTLKKEIDTALAHALSFEPDLVLCHNDTRAENIIWNKETGIAKFVDFEVISYNYRAWEIAEHFQRFAGFEPINMSLIPDEEFQLAWLRVYLEKYFEVTGRQRSDVTDVDVHRLYIQVRKFHLVGMITTSMSIPAFEEMNILPEDHEVDMIGISIHFFKGYCAAKEEILNLKMPQKDSD